MDDYTLRYSRQLILDGIGIEGQKKLSSAKVLVIGTGGLGSPILLYLASAGIGTIGVVDFDIVTLSNLNRQILHNNEDIGCRKVYSASEKLKKINPELNVEVYNERVNIDNIQDIVLKYDIVVDATDNFSTRYLISDCCYFNKIPLVEGAVVGFDGVLMTIIPNKTPCYRCLYPNPPENGVIDTCNDIGIMGATAGIIGSMQAFEVIKLICGIGETISGNIFTMDALTSNFRLIPWKKRKSCPLCGENATIKELSEIEIKCKLKFSDGM